MKNAALFFAFVLSAFLLISCGTARRSVQPSSQPVSSAGKKSSLPSAMSVSRYSAVKSSLHQALQNWEGTPYKFGGTSERGIDCSAFMQVIFDNYFGIKLPRNTKRQLYAGTGVRRNALKAGDLVFFKTGRKTLHVGVVVEDDEFLHASTSQGVTISSMDDYYWKSRYLAGRRVVQVQ